MSGLLVMLLAVAADPYGPAAAMSGQGREARLELRVGTSAPVPETDVVVTFVGVTGDSRCPVGVTCVWEGDAVVEVRVQSEGASAETLQLHTNPRFERRGRARGLTLTLERLEPHPDADAPVPPDSYVVVLRLGRNP